jgi:hypothetical protein
MAYVSEHLTHFVGRSKPNDEERFRLLLPTHYYQLGARFVRKVEGDWMVGALIGDTDLSSVAQRRTKAADG